MANNVWVEMKASSVELAVEAGMQELGIDDADQVSVEILQEAKKGPRFLGGQDAVVRVSRRKGRRRRSNKRKGQGDKGNSGKRETAQHYGRKQNRERTAAKSARNGSAKRKGPDNRGPRTEKTEKKVSDDRPSITVEEQAQIAREFLEGLVGSFGLEGEVLTKIEDDVIIADVEGEQTEALVGVRGSVRSAIHELTRTVLQRYAHDTARLRLDIAGYGERRRQALSIYADQLIEQLKTEGGEIMLEPMSPADRKVIHDAAAAHERVSSYSEGEPPRRFVVLSIEEESQPSPASEEE